MWWMVAMTVVVVIVVVVVMVRVVVMVVMTGRNKYTTYLIGPFAPCTSVLYSYTMDSRVKISRASEIRIELSSPKLVNKCKTPH